MILNGFHALKTSKVNPLLVACLLGLIGLGASAQGNKTLLKETEAVKAVIMRETSSFMNVDRKSWSELWVHASYAYWSYADSSGSSFLDGWDTINKTYEEYFKTQKPSTSKITDEWIEVRIYGNGAYARFIQKMDDGIDIDQTSQVRVLEKREGKWKVVCVSVVAVKPVIGKR